jgi:hypothetical protein
MILGNECGRNTPQFEGTLSLNTILVLARTIIPLFVLM